MRTKKRYRLLIWGVVVCTATWLMVSCSSMPENPTVVQQLPPIFPDYAGVTIPAEIAPLNFNCYGESQAMDVVVRGEKGGEIHVNGCYADFDVDEWHQLTRQNRGAALTFTVCVENNGAWTQYRDFKVEVSSDSLGEWGLTYRRIPPGYEVYGRMGIYQRELSSFSETAILENTAAPGACLNCHVANHTDPDNFTFHIRGEHGATLIHHGETTELLKAKNDSLGGSMVYPYWHPSGRFVAYSTNKTNQSFHAVAAERIEVFDHASDVLVYSPDKHEILFDSLVATKSHYENYPVFSPDGKTLYFCAAESRMIPSEYKDASTSIDARMKSYGMCIADTIRQYNINSVDAFVTLIVKTQYAGTFIEVLHDKLGVAYLAMVNNSTGEVNEDDICCAEVGVITELVCEYVVDNFLEVCVCNERVVPSALQNAPVKTDADGTDNPDPSKTPEQQVKDNPSAVPATES